MSDIVKVAFDSQAFRMQRYGGVSRYICNLAESLSKENLVKARIFAPLHVNVHLAQLKQVEPDLVRGRVGRILSRSMWCVRAAAHAESKWIAKYHPDIIHETYYSSSATPVKEARHIVTVHDMTYERYASEHSIIDPSADLKKSSLQRADHIICISDNTRSDLLDLFNLPENKVSVVHHGINKLPLVSDKLLIDALIAPDALPYILFVGQRSGYKNFARVLMAYRASNWLSENFRLVCFGGGAFTRSELEQFEKSGLPHQKIVMVGGRDELLAIYYRYAAVFVYPSLYEGFGMPLLEAMALKCPVVCSDTSSLPEVAGDAAEYFDAENIESIRAAIENVLQSSARREELIVKGLARCECFSWAKCASRTLSTYRSIL